MNDIEFIISQYADDTVIISHLMQQWKSKTIFYNVQSLNE